MEIKTADKPKFFTMTIVAADMHQGHLSPEIATMLVEEDERRRVLKNSRRLIAIIRQNEIPVTHVIPSEG